MYREYPVRLLRLERLTEALVQRRVIRLPDAVANMQLAQVDVAAAGNDIDDPAFRRFALHLHAFATHVVDTAAFFFFGRIARIEYDPVSALHGCFQLTNHAIAQNLLHAAKINAAAFRESPFHQLFIIRPVQEAVCKPAREALLQLPHLFLARSGVLPVKVTVNRLPVLAHYVCNILRRFQTAFDLERRNTRFNQLRHQIDGSQILRREQVRHVAHRLLLPVHDQVIRQAASLRALSAIG
ncbi:hypothetical protein JCM10914_5498 [Paenibacillus sp. JCM 10914]|nr:hypothetical protein JCM10914_5498 [Paenibacillus sp. JCM 10914]